MKIKLLGVLQQEKKNKQRMSINLTASRITRAATSSVDNYGFLF